MASKMVAECDIPIGARVENDGHIATVRFVGCVPPTKGIWLGVEWDDCSRGKHDGLHEGQRYFETKHPTSGSFVRPHKVNVGVTFLTAVNDRYGISEDAGIIKEQMFVVGKNQKTTTVEIVGAESVNMKQSNFEKLVEVSVRLMCVRAAGESSAIQQLLPRVKELDLSSNLLPDWQSITQICTLLGNLQILNVSENLIPAPVNPLAHTGAYANLLSLFLNKIGYKWQEIVQCMQLFKRLEILHACYNNIYEIDRVITNMDSLRLLNLESNPINNWEHVMMVGKLPNLEHLILNACNLTTIEFPDVTPEQKTSYFPALTILAFHHNKIDQWHSINELNKLQCLNHLLIQHNPITEVSKNITQESIRYNIIAKIASLKVLNRTKIVMGERKGAEGDYRKVYGLQWREAGGHQDPVKNKPNATFTHDHPRYQQLIEKYGAPEDSELVEQSSALKNSLIAIKICSSNQPDRKPLIKKLPASMSVQKLRVLVQRLFKADPLSLKLTYTSQKMPDQVIELESDQKEIRYYSIEEGDTLWAKW